MKEMKNLIKLRTILSAFILSFALLFSSCDNDSDDDDNGTNETGQSIAEIAIGNDDL
jgi:hypothetical protein